MNNASVFVGPDKAAPFFVRWQRNSHANFLPFHQIALCTKAKYGANGGIYLHTFVDGKNIRLSRALNLCRCEICPSCLAWAKWFFPDISSAMNSALHVFNIQIVAMAQSNFKSCTDRPKCQLHISQANWSTWSGADMPSEYMHDAN